MATRVGGGDRLALTDRAAGCFAAAFAVWAAAVDLRRLVRRPAPAAAVDGHAAARLLVKAAGQAAFGLLKRVCGHPYHVGPKVRLEDVAAVGADRLRLRNRTKSRHLDFVWTDAEGRPAGAVEVDGGCHHRPDRAAATVSWTPCFGVRTSPCFIFGWAAAAANGRSAPRRRSTGAARRSASRPAARPHRRAEPAPGGAPEPARWARNR